MATFIMSLFFGACLSTALPAPCASSTSTEEAALENWLEQLGDAKPGKRRTAIKRLSEFEDLKAWQAVLQHLNDEEPEVADEAQLRLSLAPEGKARELLWGRSGMRSRDDEVRLRIAECFGRMEQGPDVRRLAEAVDGRDEEVSKQLCWSIERLGNRANSEQAKAALGDVQRAAKTLRKRWRMAKHPELRARLLLAWHALDEDAARQVIDAALRHKHSAVRCSAVAIASRAIEDLERVRLASADEQRAVRTQAIQALRSWGTKPALLLLVDCLESEPDVVLKARILNALQELSGMKYRFDPRPWRLWVEQRPEDWRAQPELSGSKDKGPKAGGGRKSKAKLTQLPVRGQRVAILVDLSGSIWTKAADGTTKKQAVDFVLRKTLEGLDPKVQFLLVPYTSQPFAWKDRLMPAKARNVRDALNFFEDCRQTGRGNYHGASQWALAHDIDSILVLSDGVPTGGRRWNLDLMFKVLAEQNRFRHITFDAVLVDAKPRLVERWRAFLERTGGECHVGELPSLESE